MRSPAPKLTCANIPRPVDRSAALRWGNFTRNVIREIVVD